MDNTNAENTIIEIGKRMYLRGFVAANDGNISVRISENEIIITPAGVSKGYMDRSMLVKTDMRGNILEGKLKPSSEILLHLAAYTENPELKAVCHAHPPTATAFAAAGICPDLSDAAEFLITIGKLALVPYAKPGGSEMAEKVRPFCLSYNALLLANHGAVTFGHDLTDAYFKMETLEHCCKIIMYAGQIRRIYQ